MAISPGLGPSWRHVDKIGWPRAISAIHGTRLKFLLGVPAIYLVQHQVHHHAGD